MGEPVRQLALTRRRGWVLPTRQQPVPEVEVNMPATSAMDVQVEEDGHGLRIAEGEPGLLPRLPECCGPGAFAGVEMAARLQPQAEPPVEVENHPS